MRRIKFGLKGRTAYVAERRKQRAYLSSILSKNEIDKDDKHNCKLFYRIKHGSYIFNPRLAPVYKDKQSWWYVDLNDYAEKQMASDKALLKRLIAEKTGENP